MHFNPYFNYTEAAKLGFKSPKYVSKASLYPQLYRDLIGKAGNSEHDPRSVAHHNSQKPLDFDNGASTGGIFNLDFTPDGSILGAACERKSILLLDPITQRCIAQVGNAHEDCVNCIRFLDNRLFATCSDDTTVALWDSRFLKKKLRLMRGHTNWVKNIEYSSRNNCLVTSGFDGAIFAWDINRFDEEQHRPQNIFYTSGLMRMRLNPAGDKMIISTLNGYLIIIHDLCLESLSKDLAGFKPNMYRLLQSCRVAELLRNALNSTPLFHTNRNRVELVSDFAPGNTPEVISSLQIHPQGWVAVSRNVNSDQSSEWCCVHDIQAYPTNPDEDQDVNDRINEPVANSSESANRNSPRQHGFMMLAELLQAGNPPGVIVPPAPASHPDEVLSRPIPSVSTSEASNSSRTRHAAPNEDEFHVRHRSAAAAGGGGSRVSEFLQLLSRISNRRTLDQPGEAVDDQQDQNTSDDDDSSENEDESAPTAGASNAHVSDQNHGFLVIPSDPSTGSRPRLFSFVTQRSPIRRQRQEQLRSESAERPRSSQVPKDGKIHHNIKRLTHYIQEHYSDQGRGFIKEVSFSSDGLVLASPYDNGVRLLSFNERIEDLSLCAAPSLADPPRVLNVVGNIVEKNQEVVLSTAFSPNSFCLVTGCRGGSLSWHLPTL